MRKRERESAEVQQNSHSEGLMYKKKCDTTLLSASSDLKHRKFKNLKKNSELRLHISYFILKDRHLAG